MRRKAKKKAVGLLVLALTAILLYGCSKNPKNFTVDEMTITLTEDFKKSKMNDFDAYFVSDDVTFSIKIENASDLEYQGYEIANLKDYANEICALNGIKTENLKQRNQYYYFSNSATVSGAKYTYLHCMLKNNSDYWICEFVCKARDYKNLEETMLKWADSIVFE